MRVAWNIAILSAVCYFFIPTTNTSAQEVIAPAENTDAILHDSPPGLLPGSARGQAGEYSRYVVLEGRRVPVFFGHERWLRVVPLTPDNTLADRNPEFFWIRWGGVDDSSEDFVPVDPCEGTGSGECSALGTVRALREFLDQ